MFWICLPAPKSNAVCAALLCYIPLVHRWRAYCFCCCCCRLGGGVGWPFEMVKHQEIFYDCQSALDMCLNEVWKCRFYDFTISVLRHVDLNGMSAHFVANTTSSFRFEMQIWNSILCPNETNRFGNAKKVTWKRLRHPNNFSSVNKNSILVEWRVEWKSPPQQQTTLVFKVHELSCAFVIKPWSGWLNVSIQANEYPTEDVVCICVASKLVPKSK